MKTIFIAVKEKLPKGLFGLSPLLFIYLFFISLMMRDDLIGDEGRYIMYAENLLKGFYADPENPRLANGPGYPIYLAMFLWLDLPLSLAKYSNALLTFVGVIFFYNIMLFYFSEKKSLTVAYFLGLHLPMYPWLRGLYTEPLAFMLVSGFMYFSIRTFQEKHSKLLSVILSGVFFGFLILTKYVFFYIAAGSILILILVVVFLRKKRAMNLIYALSIGLAFTIPYFTYTYALTGKVLYASTESGGIMYWMSTSYPNEYGAWKGSGRILSSPTPTVDPRHVELLKSLENMSYLERNEVLKKITLKNIKDNPTGFLRNIGYNFFRFWFWFPESHSNRSPDAILFFISFNMFFVVLITISVYPGIRLFKLLPEEVWMLGILFLIFFLLHMALPSIPRFIVPILPFIFLWLSIIYLKVVRISLTD